MGNKDYRPIFWTSNLAVCLIGIVILKNSLEAGAFSIIKNFIIVLLFLAALEIIIRKKIPFLFSELAGTGVLCLGFGISVLLMALSFRLPLSLLWMAGSLLIAKKAHPFLGISYHLLFTFLYGSFHAFDLTSFICAFFIGGVLCLLIPYANKPLSAFYIMVTAGSLQALFQFIMHDFVFYQAVSKELMYSTASVCLLVLLSLAVRKTGYAPDNIKKTGETLWEKSAGEDYSSYLTVDTPLLRRLEKEHGAIYKHSLLVSILSERAAGTIGADEDLSKAGGLYHEIGRLNPGDYIEQGILIAREHHFPEKIVRIIEEHNGKQKPASFRESAVVMLTDTIVTMIRYYDKQEENKRISTEKIVENTFKVRLEQGTLNNAGLSIHDFQALKEFYKKNLPKRGGRLK